MLCVKSEALCNYRLSTLWVTAILMDPQPECTNGNLGPLILLIYVLDNLKVLHGRPTI